MSTKINILLVDDVEYTRELLRTTLKACIDSNKIALEPTFIQLANGDGLIDVIKNKNIGLIYLDIELPNENGVELLKKIKSEFPDITVVMVSGESSSQNVMGAIKNGASGFIVKPFNLGRISESLNNFIKKGQTS